MGATLLLASLLQVFATLVQGLAEQSGNQMVAFRESQENIEVGMNN